MLDGWLKLEAQAERQAVRLMLRLRLGMGLELGPWLMLGQRALLQIWDFGIDSSFARGLGCGCGWGQAGMKLKRRVQIWRISNSLASLYIVLHREVG